MKIKLVFKDWHQKGKSIYANKEFFELSKHDFHSGTTFEGRIDLDAWQEKELQDAVEKGYQPVFWVAK